MKENRKKRVRKEGSEVREMKVKREGWGRGWVDKPMKKWVDKSVKKWVDKPVKKWVDKPVKWVDKPVKNWVDNSMKK